LTKVLAMATAGVFYLGLVGVAVDASFGGKEASRLATAASAERSAPSSDGGASAGGPAADPAVGVAGAASSVAGGAGASAATAGRSTSASALGPRGATSAPSVIRIGIHDDDPGAAFSQFGVKGGPTGNQQVWVRKIVDWINANGGMGGRRVEIVVHVTESLNGTFDQQAEKACAQFTEDNKVAAVVGGARVPTLNLVDCLAGHNTPLIWNYTYMADQATYAKYDRYLYMPAMVSAERLGVWVDELAAQGYLKDGIVGVVRYDDPIHVRFVNNVLRPTLAAYGVAIKDEAAFRAASAASSAADLSAQANNAVLRFRTDNINRVIFVPTAAVVPLLWFAAAESQSYRPRYTLSTYDNPAFQNDNAKDTGQLVGSLAFGWTPAGDVAWPEQAPLNPSQKRCVDITGDATPQGTGSVRRFCDGLMFLKAVFDRGAEPTPDGIKRVVEAMGSSYESAWAFSNRYGPGRHDGVDAGRIAAWDGGCKCYRYTGPLRAIP
jgi:ABC-type branched-subunit amino acid transport system substrate-binding protein